MENQSEDHDKLIEHLERKISEFHDRRDGIRQDLRKLDERIGQLSKKIMEIRRNTTSINL